MVTQNSRKVAHTPQRHQRLRRIARSLHASHAASHSSYHSAAQFASHSASSASGARPGATLLFVVTMLVLFTLAGTTFLVVASQFRKSARTASRVGLHFEPPADLADQGLATVLRGSSIDNVIGPHTILADKYDALQGFKARLMRTDEVNNLMVEAVEPAGVTGPLPAGTTGGKFVVFRLSSRMTDPTLDLPGNGIILSPQNSFAVALGNSWDRRDALQFTMSQTNGFYAGSEMTFLNGPAAGRTLRIVGYVSSPVPSLVAMIERAPAPLSPFPPVVNAQSFRGIDILINSRPFSGLGAGVVSSGGNLEMTNQVLQPNRKGQNLNQLITNYLRGGTNEGYDAADNQNLFLAAIVTDAIDGTGNVRVIPSFHRPALINYLVRNPTVLQGANALTINGAMLTPFNNNPLGRTNGDGTYPWLDALESQSIASTNTAGVNFPTLRDPINGPWHVDNDGDLIPDSVWLDLGFPIRTAPDGTRYKPLFAVLATDLDGRLNVNAQGSVWHGDLNYQAALLHQTVADRANNPVQTRNLMARGQGYGTAEISLRPLFDNPAHTLLMAARYGADGVPGRQQTVAAQLEPWAEVRFFDVPRLFQNSLAFTSADLRGYSSPPDLQGRFTVTSGPDGNPYYELADGSVRPNELQESPYEMDLSVKAAAGQTRPSPADQPFSTEELELLLRRYDIDAASLPRRLGDIALIMNPTYRLRPETLVTTDSWDLPVPNLAFLPADPTPLQVAQQGVFNTGVANPLSSEARRTSIVDYYRWRRNGAAPDNEITTVFAPEVLMGQRMDLNRPFGDGRDNPNPNYPIPAHRPGNGVVDEHATNALVSESAVGEGLQTTFTTVPIDPNNNGVNNALAFNNDTDEHLARAIFARHLYVLMMTLLPLETPANPNSPVIPMDFDRDGNPTSEETAYLVAQWVANAVDSRDPDSINFGFEFDTDPFNGWTIDHNLLTIEGSDRGVVWGMERPDLLITEALAWHDRRATDEAAGMSGMGDDDLDSQLKPVGSAFIELYNPWSLTTRSPAEVATYNGAGSQGVDLRTVGAGGSPIWRMALIRPENGTLPSELSDPDFPQTLSTAGSSPFAQPNPADYDRLVYFVSQDQGIAYPAAPPGASPKVYYPTADVFAQLRPVPPLSYAVVGSAGSRYPDGGNRYVSLVGQRTDAIPMPASYSDINPDTTRRIVLVAGQSVEIQSNTAGGPVVRNNVVAIPIGDFNNSAASPEDRSFNVSEPRNGYSGQAFNSRFAADFTTDETTEFTLGTAIDQVLDDGAVGGFVSDTRLDTDGTHQNFGFVHLQRLANPLMPYHVDSNPYLTIDSTPIDVTVFNGTATENLPTSEPTEFATLERGRREWDALGSTRGTPPPVDLQGMMLWRNEMVAQGSRGSDPTSANGDAAYVFQHELIESLGILNTSYSARTPNAAIGPVNFPWLAIHNRPFVSQLDLLQVPAVRNSQLGREFTVGVTPVGSPYAPAPGNFAMRGQSPVFGHLLNWFATDGTDAPQFHRLLEFTHVPTRFIGHETYLNDQFFSANDQYTALRHPPFNRISNYREPGRININTIYDPRVWAGLQGYVSNTQQGFHDADHLPATFDEMANSRRGFGPATNGVWQLDNSMPDFFTNPFRGPGTGDLAPLPSMRRDDIETTLLRSFETINAGNNGQTPLMERSPPNVNTIQPYEEPRRSPYFRNDSLSRMGNLVTTRSNVFAVWMTVGYFEVDGNGLPDREMGMDSGAIKRHRSFYIIDRSIPVGFEPGSDHNMDEMILLQRRIE